ncbi:MAG TPA: MBL fold metallo-hydrolase [Sedimentisphaerales bacterium]|nr:MBL fold metallo-hydrolase [Sedimentisphaerales bacterium]
MAGEPEIVIDKFVLGALQTNCYCLRATRTAEDCLIIDTGNDHVEPLIDFLKANSLNPAAVIFTHGHDDHINGASLLRRHFPGIRVLIHKDDAKAVTRLVNRVETIGRDGPIGFAGIELEVLHTPGHTPGGISLYSKSRRVVFVGDTLFEGSIGRADLGGGAERLIKSIKEKLLALPDEVEVLPGHGPPTTIGKERRSNPFLQ